MTHKKRLRHPKADAVLRQEFQTRIAEYEAEGKPVGSPTKGFTPDMPRTHGYAP